MEAIKNEKIEEALEILNDSMKEKKDDVRKLINERYADVKDAMSSVSSKASRAMERRPWLFLTSIATVFLAAGYLLGHFRK